MNARGDGFVLAAIQAAPVYWDRAASTLRACELIARAAKRGASVAVFGEGWLPGYPFFSQTLPAPLAQEASIEYLANAVEVPGPVTEQLGAAARANAIDVVIGVGEIEPGTRGSVYCTLVFIGSDGRLLGKHRKLKPTGRERLVWADGDASGLQVYERPYGRLSGLNCWEHQMLLPAYSLISQGTQVHVATWPGWDPEQWTDPVPVDRSMWPRMALLSRAFASQAGSYVIACGGLWRPRDVPRRYRPLISVPRTGDSLIIGPHADILAGPLHNRPGILTARASLTHVAAAKLQSDVAGHYARPDIFQLFVDRAQRRPVDAT